MSLSFFYRVPQYGDVAIDTIALMSSYFSWQKDIEQQTTYASSSFEKYCGHSETELPPSEVLEYYRPFWDRRVENEDVCAYQCWGFFEQLFRMGKAYQIPFWIMRNVCHTDKLPSEQYIRFSRDQLEQLLFDCQIVRRYGISFVEKGEFDWHRYNVNAAVCDSVLPMMKYEGNYLAPYYYDSNYANEIVYLIRALNEILATTNFSKEAIYYRLGK